MSYKLSIVKNKMMKRIINILILLCCIASLSSCGNSTEERSRVLKIYNWADYIDEDVLAEFPDWYKQQTGEDLRIIYQVFDINEIMLTKIERGHEDFDVVCPSEYIIERMLRKDLLLPIDRNFGHTPDYIPNVSPYIRHELNKTSQPERQTEDYAVPYMWGTAGILFNKKFITAEEADTWDILWDSKNRGKILMKDSYRDAYGTAIIYAHARELADSTVTVEQLMNDNSPQAIALAEQRLKEMKPNIAGWEADFGKEMMTKNKAWINFTWSGDAVWAIEEADAVGVELDYTVPLRRQQHLVRRLGNPPLRPQREGGKLFHQLPLPAFRGTAQHGCHRLRQRRSHTGNHGGQDRYHARRALRPQLLLRPPARSRQPADRPGTIS